MVDVDRERSSNELADRARTPRPRPAASAHLEMLRRVTRNMATAQELPVLLGSITSALVEHTDAAVARGAPGALRSEGEKCLHHAATSGDPFDIAGFYHRIPLTVPSLAGKVALER